MDQNEFANALVKVGYQFPPDVVSTIFTSSDDDHSGTLELDNFIKVFFVWMYRVCSSTNRLFLRSSASPPSL